ncbi:uncharacterized protein EAF01_000730 [Botrytis porri]|uniref:Uncharacterized protein n=1 Tax=Botrytis porri TaxID=87229 RepID=A0A4Z1L470_9HELO|nr:uncharacterized protein EAF01_000730 [Botrytis porri]KAF7914324.1 hypothetical protein EAF01_000730 [Botrytis porri]TGO91592.1 hypothetical protein BPOR_0023g00170 [Botrytis porri]
MLFKTIQITLFSTFAIASPIASNNLILGRATQAETIVGGIANALTDCSTAPFPAECATLAQAAKGIAIACGNAEFTAGEIGAMIALISYESVNFQYNINHSPGRPGQGTKNMQMAKYNLQYAQSIPALKDPLAKITTATTIDGLSDDKLNEIRALVLVDEYTWGSAPWFLKTFCADARPALKTGTIEGWQAYMKCVGVDPAVPERLTYWTKAKTSMAF